MDDYLSLRSLEGSGRPFGTERPPTSPERTRGGRSNRSEPSSERADRSRSKERTRNTDRGQEAERGDFSRELDELEVSKQSGASSKPAVEPAEEPVPTDPTLDSKPAVADTVAAPLATEFGLVAEDAQTLLQPSPPKETDVSDLPVPTLDPLTELPPELAPPVLLAPLNSKPVAPVLESVTAESGEVTSTSVEAGATLNAGSGSFDTDSGNLGSQVNDASTAAHAKAEAPVASFDQALAETEAKTQARPTHSIATAESVLNQFKLEVHSKLDHAMIHLNPAELGRISVKIEMERGKLRAVLRADKAETLELLEKHVPELRASLEAGGIAAESFEFGLGLEQEAQDADQFSTPNAWKNQTEPILDELEKRSLLAKAIVNEKRVDTYA